jgi:phosphatidylglycerol:prolipoprotein diacylglycerol transferase
MYPILFRIGSYIVYSYTVALVAGMITGAWMAYRLARGELPDPSIVLDAGFWVLLGGLFGGRAGYVVSNWAYYVDHVDKALSLREGGLSWHGALLGGYLFVVVWYVLRSRFKPPMPSWRDLLDTIAPGVALGSAFGWLGCLLTGSAYGAEASGYAPPLSWLTADLPDIYGVDGIRFLTQPLMIACCLLLWVALWGLRGRLPRGTSFALYLSLYALADLGVAFLRGDGTWRWGLWLSQWIAIVEACVAIGFGVYLWIRPDRNASGISSSSIIG